MKSLVKKILASRILIFLRNNFHFKEVNFNFKILNVHRLVIVFYGELIIILKLPLSLLIY